jgi:hypothetical protein
MTSIKKPETTSPKAAKLLDKGLALILGIAALSYYILWAVIAALFGKGFATWLATPLWGVPVFIIARWDRTRTLPGESWFDSFKLPKLSYWKISVIVVVVYLVQGVLVFLILTYIEATRPSFMDSLPGGGVDLYVGLINDWQFFLMGAAGAMISFFIGGIVAGKLSSDPYLAPYSHAVIGCFIFNLINLAIVALTIYPKGILRPFTEEEVGGVILTASPGFIFSVFGVWVAARKRKSHGKVVQDKLASKMPATVAASLLQSSNVQVNQGSTTHTDKPIKTQIKSRRFKKGRRR